MESPYTKQIIIKTIQNNDLLMDEELEIFKVLFDKYQFKSITRYAKITGKSYQGVEYQIKNRIVQNIEVGEFNLVF